MEVTVRFRYNKRSGEVEVFEVDQERTLPGAEHEREHDQLASELGRLLEAFPEVQEIAGGAGRAAPTRAEAPTGEVEQEPERLPDQPTRERDP